MHSSKFRAILSRPSKWRAYVRDALCHFTEKLPLSGRFYNYTAEARTVASTPSIHEVH